MIARHIPLRALAVLALAAFPLAGAAQQPAQPNSAAPAGHAVSSPQAGQPQAPQGNLTIQVTDDNGNPVPGAGIEIDGMRVGGAPAGPGTGRSSTLASGTRIIGADPNPSQSGSSQSRNDQSSIDQPAAQPVDQSGLFHARSRPCPTPPPRAQQERAASGNALSASGSSQSGNAPPGQPPSAHSGSAPAGAQPAHPQPPPDCGLTNMVQAGTAESISDLGGASTDAAPVLPAGAVPLQTDAQGQLTVQLPPGEHTLSLSVYGFDPWSGHFTLAGKHRQIVQIKLSTAPTTTIIAVGPDGRIQPVSEDLDALIPTEPLQTLVSLAPRSMHRGL